MTRVLDIGVFAHNEAAGIADLIGDIGRQTVFQDPRTDLRVYVLANGCTDATVPVARDAIGALPESARARIEVIDLPQGGNPGRGIAISMNCPAPEPMFWASWTPISACPSREPCSA
jgi:hypothetical protein